MTSPNIGADGLPIIVFGMIWDGVTQYSSDQPVGGGRLCRLVGDGSRRYTETANLNQPSRTLLLFQGRGWESIGVANGLDASGLIEALPAVWNIGYLGYDGTRSTDPVNQITYLLPFREHAARFAHQLDAAMGHHTLYSAEENDRLTTLQTLSAMIGSAWRRYDEWALVDPEELILGGVYDGTTLWSRNLADFQALDATLCGQCEIATFARRFYFQADLPAFRRLWRSGYLYAVDRSTTPWSPELFDVATQPQGEYHDALDAAYHAALEYYDTVVGAPHLAG